MMKILLKILVAPCSIFLLYFYDIKQVLLQFPKSNGR